MSKIARETSLRLLESVTKVGETIKVLLLAILLIAVSAILIDQVWPSRSNRQSITITSFADTSGDKNGGFGLALADKLEFEILRIAQLHALKNPWGGSQDIPALELTGQQTVERGGGTIGVPGVELPLDLILQTLKQWFTRPRTQYMITGSLQRFPPGHSAQEESSGARQEESSGDKQKGECRRFPPGNGTRVQIIVRLEEDGRLLKRWSCVSKLTSQDEINVEIRPTLMQYLQDIAYEVMWVALERTEANSLENFKNFIEGVDHFRTYKDNKKHDETVFKKAEKLISEKVIQENEKFARAHFYLGNLYSWRANYAHTEKDYNKRDEYEKKAKEQYEKAGNGIAIKPSEAMAYKHFGIGLVDYRHYRNLNNSDKMKIENRKLLEAADQNFQKAWEGDKEFYFAKSGSALLYTEEAMLLKAHLKKLTEQKLNSNEPIRELREQETYLDEAVKACLKKAIAEFQSSREAASKSNHIDSLKWIDKKILDLNLEMGAVLNMESRRPQLLSLFSGLFHAGSRCPDFNSSQSSTTSAEK